MFNLMIDLAPWFGAATAVLILLYVLALGLSTALSWAWYWIDDGDKPRVNWFISWQCRLYKGLPTLYPLPRKNCIKIADLLGIDTASVIRSNLTPGQIQKVMDEYPHIVRVRYKFLWYYPLGIVFAPLAIWIVLAFWQVFAIAGLAVGVALSARAARRHRKLFDQHVNNPTAHKE